MAAIEGPCTTVHRPLIVFCTIFIRFGDIVGFVRPEPIIPYPTAFPAEIDVSFGLGPRGWAVQREERLG